MKEQFKTTINKANYAFILGMRVDPTSYSEVCDQVKKWQTEKSSRYVCVANVHMTMEAFDSPSYQDVINQADLVTPDGMPLVWTLRRMGYKDQERVYGPTLTEEILKMASDEHIPVGFFGSTTEVLDQLVLNIKKAYPQIEIGYVYSPPFKDLTDSEDEQIVAQIQDSGIRILFVGLGCPKQEKWMHAHRGKFPAVMLGVGAAFDFIAGIKPQAPSWIQKSGLEWLFRLATEPKRLWRRYFHHNPRFVYQVALQLLRNTQKPQ